MNIIIIFWRPGSINHLRGITCLTGILLLFLFYACQEKPDLPQVSNRIEFSETDIALEADRTLVETSVTYEITPVVLHYGHCWSTTPNPSTGDHKTEYQGNLAGSTIKSTLSALQPGQEYHVRAYIQTRHEIIYSSDQVFTTLASLPTINTIPATNITTTSAQSGGNITSEGSSLVTARGVCYGTSPNPDLAGNYTIDGSGGGAFTSNLTGLSANTLYYVRAYATSAVGTTYGNQISFTTLGPCAGATTVNHGGQTYNTVAIGTQCWFKENLNIGTMILGTSNQTNNGTIEKYCFNNDAYICAIYGGLYQWDEMMNYSTTPGTQGICPTGWHIPTDSEWCTLTTYLDATVNCNTLGWSGTDAGGKMKETGYDHWYSPNTGATNSSGFTALGAGRRYSNGDFTNLITNAYFWSSSEYSSTNGLSWSLSYNYPDVSRDGRYGTNGFSVRCLRNN